MREQEIEDYAKRLDLFRDYRPVILAVLCLILLKVW